VKQSRQDLEDVPDVVVGHHQDLHGRPDVGKLGGVVTAVADDAAALTKKILQLAASLGGNHLTVTDTLAHY
jgi:hypothetical protein